MAAMRNCMIEQFDSADAAPLVRRMADWYRLPDALRPPIPRTGRSASPTISPNDLCRRTEGGK